MDDRNIRLALPAGTVLCCGGDRYILGEVSGFGGSSVFYTAKKEGSDLPFGVKECCPGELAGRLRREGGILFGADEQADDALVRARERMLRETVISQDVAAVSPRRIPAWDAPADIAVETAEGTAAAPAGSFLLLRDVSCTGMFLPRLQAECALPKSEGHPLRTGGLPGLHTIACILEQTLCAVELVHVTGYLYGDVQPENIFFADVRPEKGDIGFACLLDFGCTRVFDDFTDGEKTARIKDRRVFSTPGYTAPEIIRGNDGTLQLTPAADIYSVGRLLLFLLRGCTYFENGRDRVLTEGAALTCMLPSEGEKPGCTGESLRLLQRLLDRSLAPEPEERYQAAAEMLEDVEALVRLTRPPQNQPAPSFSDLAEGEF